MKDQLPRYLFLTAEIRKAIDKNTKQDGDLSLVLKQLDKEKEMALKQIVRRKEDLKKQILKQRGILPQTSKAIQVYGNRQKMADRGRPHPEELIQTTRPLHRTVSLDETFSTSNMKEQLPRYLLPTDNMRKAIDRNTKQDGDLSLVLKQLDKEKEIASRKMVKRHRKISRSRYSNGEKVCLKRSTQFRFMGMDRKWLIDNDHTLKS
ncbi:hypothetical protein AWC38_SpisGene13343 [Stylophora pistillata]|uniref:Uncharacterized protein n=1 Tax=Stylophora pistillata TaxID=50429 RepID=A0A2B4RZD4_STYPI|nr:hypothetical protein AWC38_SpisGene13343 [Stylophora pistillata]